VNPRGGSPHSQALVLMVLLLNHWKKRTSALNQDGGEGFVENNKPGRIRKKKGVIFLGSIDNGGKEAVGVNTLGIFRSKRNGKAYLKKKKTTER